MTLFSAVPHTHPILSGCDRLSEVLDEIAVSSPVFLGSREKGEALRELAVLEARVAAARLRVLAVAGDVAEEGGHRDLGSWLHAETRAELPAARAEVRLASSLDSSYAVLAAALGRGGVSVPQARVIEHALRELPAELAPALRAKAESHLIDLAALHTPQELRRLSRALLQTLDPEHFEAAEARALDRLEQAAARRVSCRFRDHGDGTVAVDLKLPLADAIRLKTYLEAYAQPRKQTSGEGGARVPYDRLLGQGFQHLLAHLDPDALPHHGGDATTVIVTIPLADLVADLGTAHLGWSGDTVTAGEARRLACQAHLIPAVLGSHGEILDLGRATRLYTPVQRRAIRLRDRHCRAEHCSIPAPWCDVHHLQPWSEGGKTDLSTGVLLCGHHHRQIHQPGVDTTVLPTGDLRYHRRT